MKRDRLWLIGLTFLTAIILMISSNFSSAKSSKITIQTTQLVAEKEVQNSGSLALYQDPAQRFKIAILEGYKATSLGNNNFIIESPDGNLAYTVVVRPRATNNRLTDASLAQVAIDTFSSGEGFIAGQFQKEANNNVRIPWTGSLSLGRANQPMSGIIVTRQVDNKLLSLLVAATEAGADNVESVVNTLSDSF